METYIRCKRHKEKKIRKLIWGWGGGGDKSILREPNLTLSNFDTFAQNIDCGYTLEPRRFQRVPTIYVLD